MIFIVLSPSYSSIIFITFYFEMDCHRLNQSRSLFGNKEKQSIFGRIITICLGGVCIGFNIIFYYTMAQSIEYFNQKITNYQLIGAIIPITAIIGSGLVGYFLEKHITRRHLLMFSGFFGIFGNILSIISFLFNVSNDIFNIPLFVVGRIFQGVMVGINMTFCLVIINQFSPYQFKLTAITIYQMTIEFGIIIPVIFYPLLRLGFSLQWKYISIIMYCFTSLILVIQFLLLKFVYCQQPPLYLIKQKQFQKAKSILSMIYEQQQVQQKFLQFQQNIAQQYNSQFETDYDLKTIWKKGLFLGFYAVTVQQMSGIYFWNIYNLFKINQLNYSEIFLNCIPYFCQFFATLLLFLLVYTKKLQKFVFKSKRKQMIQFGSILFSIILACLLILLSFDQLSEVRYLWLIVQCFLMFIYGFTLGTVVWVYISQLLKPNQLQITISFYWILASLNMFVFPFLNSFSLIIVPIVLLISSIFFTIVNRWFLIQTKNQSALQIVRKLDDFSYCNLKNK